MLIAGNWKMNTGIEDGVALAKAVVDRVGALETGPVGVAVCPPYTHLVPVAEVVTGSGVDLGAQNMHDRDAGAFTGEVAAPVLKALGCRYVILGHSERRQYFCETDDKVNRKIRQALGHGLTPILCIGETLEQRELGDAESVVQGQLEHGLADIELASGDDLVVAYEPVWAIGTGRTATPDQAQDIHAFIRAWLRTNYGPAIANGMNILYGGSVKPGNAASLLSQTDIDGGLIGGASLKADAFVAIVQAAIDV